MAQLASWLNALESWVGRVWTLIEPLIALGGLILTWNVWRRLRNLRRRTSIEESGPLTVVNLSGRRLLETEDGWAQRAKVIGDGPIEWDNQGGAQDLDRSCRKALQALPQEVLTRLLAGDRNIVLALPGYAPAAFHVTAVLHGVLGHFPRITYPLRVPGDPARFSFVAPVDGQAVRDSGRRLVGLGGPALEVGPS